MLARPAVQRLYTCVAGVLGSAVYMCCWRSPHPQPTYAPCTLRGALCWQCYQPPDWQCYQPPVELLVDLDEVKIQGKDWAVSV